MSGGTQIGPLVAAKPAIASVLYTGLCGAAPAGDAVYLDVPMPNTHAVAMAKANGMSSVFETARMYAGPAPECDLNAVYGVTTFELG